MAGVTEVRATRTSKSMAGSTPDRLMVSIATVHYSCLSIARAHVTGVALSTELLLPSQGRRQAWISCCRYRRCIVYGWTALLEISS